MLRLAVMLLLNSDYPVTALHSSAAFKVIRIAAAAAHTVGPRAVHCQPDYTSIHSNVVFGTLLQCTGWCSPQVPSELHLNHVVGALDTDRAQDWVAPALARHTLSGAPLGQ